MKLVECLFWIGVFVVFYTYVGYGLLLWCLIKFKRLFKKEQAVTAEIPLPEVTLFIAAYNEADIVAEKMANTLALNYPAALLKIIWVTDGSTDDTNRLLSAYQEVQVCFSPERKGKTAAINRAMPFVNTPIVIFTDANTMLNKEAIREIVYLFSDQKVGCVAGEKRIAVRERDQASSSGEGFYWRYESALKKMDSELYSAVGAAGELFAIRTSLFEQMENDTLLDDFILSLRIAARGYKIAYCDKAYAIETGSADMTEEQKRKVRIAAGGLQSIWRLRHLLNIFKYGMLSFQYISHRVLRWSITPVLLFLLLPLNLILAIKAEEYRMFYVVFLFLQFLFYAMAWCGARLEKRQLKIKVLFIPYYFTFMNVNVLKAFIYLRKNKGKGAWEKAKRG